MKCFFITACIVLLFVNKCFSQEGDSLRQLENVIVTANKFEEKSRNLAQKIEVLDSAFLQKSISNNPATLLDETGKVFVQRSQQGGGSPVIRGFEASRILLVLDGVRLNNAIYRTGHSQNIISIDDKMLDRIEILSGPASTIYGSDALGGVIHLQTRKPTLSLTDKTMLQLNAGIRYGSASNEYTGHIDVNAGGKHLASLTSLSYSTFGDLRQGNARNPFYGDFGKRQNYITQIDGVDSIVDNKDVNVQQSSGYRQLDLLQKFLWQPDGNRSHSLNIQYTTSSDIPRYDRLTDKRDGLLRWAEWYYGPQQRLLVSYQYKIKGMKGFFDQMLLGINYQDAKESRVQRGYRKAYKEHRSEHIKVPGFNADLRKSSGRNELNIGLEGQFNVLKSTAFSDNIYTGQKKAGLDTRYPDGKNTMSYTGIYMQHLYKIVPDKWILNDGARVNYISMDCRFEDTSILHLPFTKAAQHNLTFSANAGIIYLPDEKGKFSLALSTGFRAPNIDDMSKVFESAGGSKLVVPNPGLRPEQTINLDLGLSRSFNGVIHMELCGFYNVFRNAIVLDAFTLNGRDSVEYNGQLTAVAANQNKAKATIYGFQGNIHVSPLKELSIYSNLTFTHGRYTNPDESIVPMDHIPPVFGKTAIVYRYKILETEIAARYNGWKKAEDYNPDGEDNQQYATIHGMPSWCTLNISTNWHVHKKVYALVALENVFDQNYRVFASGISSAGRNLVLKLRASI